MPAKVTAAAGLNPVDWTPRELRHSFVSLLSDAGVPVEKIARLVGHIGTTTTETVYRHQIRPVVTGGAEVMDQLFPRRNGDAWLLSSRKAMTPVRWSWPLIWWAVLDLNQ